MSVDENTKQPPSELTHANAHSTMPDAVEKASTGARIEKFFDSRKGKNWIKFNQSSTIFNFCVAMLALGLATSKFTGDNKKADEDRIAKTWDVVTRMSGKQSNGGQVSALELLAARSTPLGKIDLHNTYFAKAKLPNVELQDADLQGADLQDVDLSGANLTGADLRHTNLKSANLTNAILDGADLGDSNLAGAKLRGAQLAFAVVEIEVFEAADVANADFTGATFVFVDSDGFEHWDDYADTLAESPAADAAQKVMDAACSDARYNVAQNKAVPFTQSTKPCKQKRDYQGIRKFSFHRRPPSRHAVDILGP